MLNTTETEGQSCGLLGVALLASRINEVQDRAFADFLSTPIRTHSDAYIRVRSCSWLRYVGLLLAAEHKSGGENLGRYSNAIQR